MSTTTDITTEAKSINLTATRQDLNFVSNMHDVSFESFMDINIESTQNNVNLTADKCINLKTTSKSINLDAENGKINLVADDNIKLKSVEGNLTISSDRKKLDLNSYEDSNMISQWGDITIEAINGNVNIKCQKNVNITPGSSGSVNVDGNLNAVSISQGPISENEQNSVGLLVPTGSIMPYCGTTSPSGWFLCDGSSYSIITYNALFNVINNTFGGSVGTTFAVPDMRGRVVVGSISGTSGFENKNVGDTGGEETHTLTVNEIPSHNHTVDTDISGWESCAYTVAGAPDRANRGSNSTPTTYTGGGLAHNIMQPYMTLNYIIKY